MKIPKYIKEKIEKRCDLAEQLIALEAEIDKWLESKGIEPGMGDYSECTLNSFILYTEPGTARDNLLRLLENEE